MVPVGVPGSNPATPPLIKHFKTLFPNSLVAKTRVCNTSV
jgi:hypothetical protein